MNFYEEWDLNADTENEEKYIDAFLKSTKNSLDVFLKGSRNEIIETVSLLINTPISKFIDCLKTDNAFEAKDIVQFSNFEHAVIQLPILCNLRMKPLSFSEVGKLLINPKNDVACKKYGENHSKLAYELSFVKMNKVGSYFIENTALGDFSVTMKNEQRIELIKRLALRNKFIKSLIFKLKNKNVNYEKMALTVLSKSTAQRRKSNVKFLVALILNEVNMKYKIEW